MSGIDIVNVRLVKEPYLYSVKEVKTSNDAIETIAEEFSTYDREVFAVLNLNTRGQVINVNVVAVGTLNASLVHPREVFKSCILSNAASFIAIHNHPSGSTDPSNEDIQVTKRLKQCGNLLGISMLDHIIIGGESGDTFSFAAEGLMLDC